MSQRIKLPPYQRKKSNNTIFTNSSLLKMQAQIIPEKFISDLPKGMVVLENQVAGHTFQEGTDAIGILKDQHDGSIMKPANKPLCGVREINFYEELHTTKNSDLEILKEFIPEYRGTIKLNLVGKEIEFIKLTDLTYGMMEPCVMDIKIGERTWDPLATNEKRQAEEQKYSACKKNLGLCIPGFQVYSINNGKCKKYGKEYGKKLNEKTIKDTLKKFLNGENGFCRVLLMKILSGLWGIQKWARTQKTIKLYSSSILIVYDARRLRLYLDSNRMSMNNLSYTNGALSNGTISPPVNGTCTSPTNEIGSKSQFKYNIERKISEPIPRYRKIQRTHSMQHNYDEEIRSICQDYTLMLNNLVINDEKQEWAYVKMIDFAHVFPNEDNSLDSNYLFGIDSLVKLFEEFLKECE